MGLSQLHNPRKSIGVMPRVAPLAKAPYWMSHDELKELKVQFEELQRDTLNLVSHHMGQPSSLFTRRTGRWGCAWIIEPSTRWPWRIDTHYLELMICLIDFQELKCLVRLTYVQVITKFESQKGMKKRSFVTQGMAHMSS
jgi:hypothetical protein